jgi:protein TonB
MHLDMRGAAGAPSRMMLAISAAVVLEAGALYLVGSGLAMRILTPQPRPVNIDVLKDAPKVAQPPALPQTQFVRPSLPAVTRPLIDVQTPSPSNPVTVLQSQHAPTTPLPAAAQAQVKTPPVPTPPHGIAATHTQPPYPVLARRIGKEGSVVLDITVATDGAVQDVSIAKSSGDDGLDEAAMNWVREHWRYKPAMKDGLPVVAQSEAQVVFSLRQSR